MKQTYGMSFDYADWPKPDPLNSAQSAHATCQKCAQIISMIIDGEAHAEHLEYFKTHIKICQKCLEIFVMEKEVKKLIQKKIRKKNVPSEVIISILERI